MVLVSSHDGHGLEIKSPAIWNDSGASFLSVPREREAGNSLENRHQNNEILAEVTTVCQENIYFLITLYQCSWGRER